MNASSRNYLSGIRPTVLLGAICLVGWMAFILWPRLLEALGIVDYGMMYLDSYAILAALDAVRAGLDPHRANPYDFLLRYHVYSDWWLGLRWLGLGRADNFLVGSAWALAFALSCWLVVRPRNFGEAGWMTAMLLSPPFLLVLLRANNDLVIFVLLMGWSVAASGTGWLRQCLAVGVLILASGLKYYPAPAALAMVWVRPLRRMPVILALALIGVAAALASLWPQLARSQFRIEVGVHLMGAPLLGRALGLSDPTTQRVSLGLLVLAAVGLARGRFTTGLASRGEPRERLLAVSGAILLLACFVAGVNFAYRWIFVFWMALWLWRQSRPGRGTSREVRTAQVACGLVMFCLWQDGILCLVVNELSTMTPAQSAALDNPWRLATQPFNWLLMMLLSGWLLEGAVATLQAWWRERKLA